MKLKLSCTEEENLCKALKDAYRDYESLKRMVYIQLNRKNLDDIASNKKLDDVVFNLIVWARQEDSLLDLIWGAYERNPRNSAIQNISISGF